MQVTGDTHSAKGFVWTTGPGTTKLHPRQAEGAVCQCVWSLTAAESDTLVVLPPGISLVSMSMKPPEKSAGYSGAGDLMICRLSIWLLGMM